MPVLSIVPWQSEAAELITLLGSEIVPSLSKAVRKSANMILREWTTRVRNSPAKEGWKRNYASAIQVVETGDPLSVSVEVENMYANFVEDGIKRTDLKKALLAGPNAKTFDKSGEKYNIVFFEKKTPGAKGPAMPKNVYEAAKALDTYIPPMYRKGSNKYRVNKGRNEMNMQSKRASDLSNRIVSGSTRRLVGPKVPDEYKGLVKTGKKGHTQYGTFRMVTENSQGWIRKRIPKVPIFRPMVEAMGPMIKEVLSKGLEKDLVGGLRKAAKAL
jgi:hypothetical protein